MERGETGEEDKVDEDEDASIEDACGSGETEMTTSLVSMVRLLTHNNGNDTTARVDWWKLKD